ncbi:hypothetical protein D3C73_952700 [compost metagenome]
MADVGEGRAVEGCPYDLNASITVHGIDRPQDITASVFHHMRVSASRMSNNIGPCKHIPIAAPGRRGRIINCICWICMLFGVGRRVRLCHTQQNQLAALLMIHWNSINQHALVAIGQRLPLKLGDNSRGRPGFPQIVTGNSRNFVNDITYVRRTFLDVFQQRTQDARYLTIRYRCASHMRPPEILVVVILISYPLLDLIRRSGCISHQTI